MKKYIRTIIIILFVSFVSCNIDQLDIPQQGVLPVDVTYTNADDETVESFMAAIYYKIHGDAYSDKFGGTSLSTMTLRYHLGMMGGEFAEYFQYVSTSETPTYYRAWSYFYSIIYWSNMIIEKIPENQIASKEVKNRAIAEARVIRAIMMMNLVQLYGNPPLADHIMTGEEANTPASESWEFIESELSDAAENLPSKDGTDGQAAIGGRLTKEAAFAYLGKAYLWQEKYTEAANTLYNKVIATNLYSLIDDYAELNRYTSDFSSENLWESDITDASGYEVSQAGLFDVASFSFSPASLFIPDELYDLQGFGYTCYASEAFGVFMKEHDAVSSSAKSARYNASIASYEELLDESIFQYSEGEKGVKSTGIDYCEGYFRIKLLPRTENIMGLDGWVSQYSHKNLCYMRYSEVLLNYAEAVAMGGNEGELSGLDALNMVRNRAGLSNAPMLDMDNAEYGIKAERRAELFFEGTRFIDLIRWGDAPAVLSDCGKYLPHFYGYQDGNNAVIQSKEDWKIIKNPTLGEGFITGKNELFPIPATDKNNNPNLVQNPGW